MKTCSCGEPWKKGFRFCPHCGKRVYPFFKVISGIIGVTLTIIMGFKWDFNRHSNEGTFETPVLKENTFALSDSIENLELEAKNQPSPYLERLIANLWLQRGNESKAINWFEIYLSHEPRDGRARLRYAQALWDGNLPHKAFQENQKLREQYPLYQEAWIQAAKMAEASGKGAESFLQKAEALEVSGQAKPPPLLTLKQKVGG